MPENMKDAQRAKIISYALVILIFVALTSASFFWKSDSSSQGRLTFSNDGYLRLQDSSGAITDIYYCNLKSVIFCNTADFGEPAGGSISNGIREGRWQSETFGDYIASVDTELTSCVLLCTEQDTYAISYESNASTKALCDALLKAAGLSE